MGLQDLEKDERKCSVKSKRPSLLESVAPPMLAYRNSLDLSTMAVPILIVTKDRKCSYAGPYGVPPLPQKQGVPPEDFNPWEQEDPNAPRDRFNFIRIALFVLGFTGLLPFTMLITANEYWMYKFRDVDLPWANYSAENRTELQVAFASYQMIGSIGPSVIFNFISTFVGHKIKMNIRARAYFLLLVLVFVVNTIMTQVDTDSWQLGFFLLTMGSQVVLSLAGVLGIVILPITTKFPKSYLQTHLVGHGLAGIVTSSLRMVSIACSPSTTQSAYIYFGVGTALMVTSYVMFEMMMLSPCYKYYVTDTQESEAKKQINSFTTVLKTAKSIWPILVLNSVSIFLPTMCIVTLVVSENQGSGSAWSDKYFVTTATYMIPAVAEIIGRALSNQHISRFCNGKFLSIATIFKIIVFTPLVYMSNAQPRHHLPVWLKHDWEYMLMSFMHALLMGFMMNLNMFWTTSLVPHDKMELAFRIIFMLMGAMGSLSSPLNVLAVKII